MPRFVAHYRSKNELSPSVSNDTVAITADTVHITRDDEMVESSAVGVLKQLLDQPGLSSNVL